MLAQPRISNVRTAKTATQTRRLRAARARYSTHVQFCAGLCVVLAAVMLYVMLTARLTSLNYAVGKAQHERTVLQEQTARLDDRLDRMESDDRLARLAAQLHMREPQQFALVTLPRPHPQQQSSPRLAFLAGLAGLFRAK